MARHGLLHSYQGQDLQQVILHHVADDTELVEIAASAFGAERLLESDLHRGYVVPVPRRVEHPVAESESHQILHHLLAKVVIDTINLLLVE